MVDQEAEAEMKNFFTVDFEIIALLCTSSKIF